MSSDSSPPLHTFLPVKLNTLCTQALNPCYAFLHIVPIAWNWLFTTSQAPRLRVPPYGPIGKFLLPFKSLICNFYYQINHPSLHETKEFVEIQNFSAKTRRIPSKLGQVGYLTPLLIDRMNLSNLLFSYIFLFLMLLWVAHCLALIHVFSWALVHAHSCPILCNPVDYSLSDSSVHGIFQARILE